MSIDLAGEPGHPPPKKRTAVARSYCLSGRDGGSGKSLDHMPDGGCVGSTRPMTTRTCASRQMFWAATLWVELTPVQPWTINRRHVSLKLSNQP
jgi:hypothetical protein